eukprot:TRINITY_DN76195_c0_g1_i1.p1 TRINITY_DN76195_c0_g1~~TRINITY_DN76195_c0_g1_i1.p1  ORF type:complete len:647 (+),score=124.87 TRINITY_DN76195_c0_g1_i1:34-1941(+)
MADADTNSSFSEGNSAPQETIGEHFGSELSHAVELLGACVIEQGRLRDFAVSQVQLAAQQQQKLEELGSRFAALLSQKSFLVNVQPMDTERRPGLKMARSSNSLSTVSTSKSSQSQGVVNADIPYLDRDNSLDEDCDNGVVFQLAGLSESPVDGPSMSRSVQFYLERTQGRFLQHVLHMVVRVMQHVESIREPERKGCLAKAVGSSFFNTLCMVVVTLNAVFITLDTEREMSSPGQAPSQDTIIIETAFFMFYVIELILKMAVHRFYFFCNKDMKWNILDALLVLAAALENTLTLAVASGGPAVNLASLRLLRLCKVAKVLRIFRTLEFFQELRLMAECVAGTLVNAFWCTTLLFFIIYIFTLLICQGLVAHFEEHSHGHLTSEANDKALRDYYGSVPKTMLTLLQSISNGVDWSEAMSPLAVSGPILPAIYVMFVLLFAVSVWNIVTSVFVEKAMKLTKPDLEAIASEQTAQDQREVKNLTKLFAGRCLDDNGMTKGIGMEEFRTLADDSKFRAYLHARGIDINNVEVFFQMLASASGKNRVSAQVLANACVRMKGLATSIDLQSLSFETKMSDRKQAIFLKRISRRLTRIERLVQVPAQRGFQHHWSELMQSQVMADSEHAPESPASEDDMAL